MKAFLTLTALLSLSIPRSDAAVVISGDFGTGATLSITQELQFTVTGQAEGFIVLVLDEWASVAGSSQEVNLTSGLVLKRGDEVVSWSFQRLIEASVQPWGAVTPNDILFFFNLDHTVQSGDVLTLSTGTSNLTSNANFGPLTGNEFRGNAFLVGSAEGLVLSNVVPIPEPGAMGIGAGLLLLLLATRPKRASGIVPSKEE